MTLYHSLVQNLRNIIRNPTKIIQILPMNICCLKMNITHSYQCNCCPGEHLHLWSATIYNGDTRHNKECKY